jgi:hypothetical protein
MKTPKVTVTLAFALAQQAFEKLRDQENKSEKELQKTIESDPLIAAWKKNRAEIERISKINKKLERDLNDKFKREIYVYDNNVSLRGKSKIPTVSEIKTELLMLSHIDGIDAKQLVTEFLKRNKKSVS